MLPARGRTSAAASVFPRTKEAAGRGGQQGERTVKTQSRLGDPSLPLPAWAGQYPCAQSSPDPLLSRVLRVALAERERPDDPLGASPLPDAVLSPALAGDRTARRELRRLLRGAERALGLRHQVRRLAAAPRSALRVRQTGGRVAHRVGRPAPSRTAAGTSGGSSDGPAEPPPRLPPPRLERGTVEPHPLSRSRPSDQIGPIDRVTSPSRDRGMS